MHANASRASRSSRRCDIWCDRGAPTTRNRLFMRRKHHNPISFEMITFIMSMVRCGPLWGLLTGENDMLNNPVGPTLTRGFDGPGVTSGVRMAGVR